MTIKLYKLDTVTHVCAVDAYLEIFDHGLRARRGEKLTVDHIMPRSRGGQTTWTNVVAACLRCNLFKGNRTLEEARLRLIREPIHPQFLFSVHLLRHPHASSFLDSWRKYLVAVPSSF